MALTISQYYDLLVTEKQTFTSLIALQPNVDDSQTLLTDLNSSSKVARWRLIFWVMAYAIWIIVVICEQLAKEKNTGRPAWYQKAALEFQYGYALDIIDGVPAYPIVDLNARIIKLVSVVEANGILYKVAKLISGVPVPLDSAENAAFYAYVQEKKLPGNISVISQLGDTLVCGWEIYYNPLLLDANGVLIADGTSKPVEQAIAEFLATFALVQFNGILHADTMNEAIKKALGVVHIVPVLLKAKPFYESSSNYRNILTEPGQRYNPEAGYFAISTTPGETLSDTITYIPYS